MAAAHVDSGAQRALALASELRVLIGKLRRRLRAGTSYGDYTESQLSVVRRLDRNGPATVTTLARAEGVRPQSMGATVASLEAAGFLGGAPDPTDGRQTLWSLTAACRRLIQERRAAKEDWLFRSIREKLTAEEQKDLVKGVALLERLVEHDE